MNELSNTTKCDIVESNEEYKSHCVIDYTKDKPKDIFINLLKDNMIINLDGKTLEEYVTDIHLFNNYIICDLLDYFNSIVYYNYTLVVNTNCKYCLKEHLRIYDELVELYDSYLTKYNQINKANMVYYNKKSSNIYKKIINRLNKKD